MTSVYGCFVVMGGRSLKKNKWEVGLKNIWDAGG